MMSEAGPGPGEDDRDSQVVTSAFAAFREVSRDVFAPPPVRWVYTTASRRQQLNRQRGWLATAAAVLPAMLLLLGSTTLLSVAGGDERRPAGSDPATVDATLPGSPQASGSRSAAPGSSPQGRETTRPQGGTSANLASAAIDLPGVAGCPGGVLVFTAGHAEDVGGCAWQLGGWPARHADLDGVAGEEIVTRFTAAATSGVVALRPPAADARPRIVRTMGYVMTTDPTGPAIGWVDVSSGGLITVGLSGGANGGTSQQPLSYRWDPSAQAFLSMDVPPEPPATELPLPPSPEPEPSALDPSLTASPSP
jgi:hypothetical protein